MGFRFGGFPGVLGGVGKRQNLQTLAPGGRPESSGISQELVPVAFQRFQKSLGGHLDLFWSFLGPFQPLPEAPGGHWERSGGVGSTEIMVWRLPGAAGSTKIVFWTLPGAAGSTKQVVLVPLPTPRVPPRWPATAIRDPTNPYNFYMIINS